MPESFDAVIINAQKNRRYLTGFDYSDGYVVVTRKTAYLLTDFRYIESALEFKSDDLQIVDMNGSFFAVLSDIIMSDNIRCLGYEDEQMTCAELAHMRDELPLLELLPMGKLLSNMREIKDQSELDSIIKAQRIAESAFEDLLKIISPSMTELDVAVELEYAMRKKGASANAFDTIAVSGTSSSLPHGVPSANKLQKGFLTIDFGALYDNYCSDMTRTIVIGKADEEMKKIYNTVLQAQLAAIEFLSSGTAGNENYTGAAADKVARDIIYRAGYEGCFGHGLGHGVGMDIHENPRLSRVGTSPLLAGQVVTVEPGIYIAGKYGVRIEDMVVIRPQGIENLTLTPKQLIEI